MAGVASVHIADVGALRALGRLRRPRGVPGLRQADVGTAAPLGPSVRPSVMPGRVALVAFWDDDAAIDRFLATSPWGEVGGWSARLEPLRRFGMWPGLDASVQEGRATEWSGPSIVLTLGRLRLTQAVRFVRTSAPAEGSALASSGFVWGTALARPPFVATCSLWSSTNALSTYAYGRGRPAHSEAIAADAAKPFHHRSAFVRFRPHLLSGSLGGRNPLPEAAITV